MRVIVLSARTGWHTDELCRALAERGHTARVLAYEALVGALGGRGGARLASGGEQILDADAVLARIIPNGSLEQIIYRVDALHWIEERGIPVMNSPRAIERSVDKFYTTALLAEAGLPVPETVVCEGAAEALAAIRPMLAAPASAGVVIKPIFGSMGHGLVRVTDPDVAARVVRPLAQMRSVFYVQRAIEHDGCDLRVFVVGGRVLAAIERRAADGEWRTNVSLGGTVRAIAPTAECGRLAVAAASAVGAEYAGVDLLRSREGEMFVLEVNGIPGWEGLQRATGVDVAGAIVDHLEASLARRVPAPDGAAEVRA